MKKQQKLSKTKPKNELPNGVNTKDFLQALENISKRLAYKFRFAYHSVEDMKQQAAIFALEGLENYDNKRPLENFLWTHVRNRLFNYKRNNYQRPDKPCHSCPFFDKGFKMSLNQCEKYENTQDCDLYTSWVKRNEVKKNIIQPSYIENSLHQTVDPGNFDMTMQNQELTQFLDEHIQSEFRESYLKLKNGSKISKLELKKLQQHILTMMENQNWKPTTFQENEDN